MSLLTDRVIVVTGGGRGIGRAICLTLAEGGAIVVPVARTAAEVEETADLARQAGGQALALAADLTDRAQVQALAARVLGELGRVDTLLANAGSFYALGPVAEADPERWWTDVRVNLQATFLPCRYLLPAMIAAGRGQVITMLGGGTGNPLPFGSAYASSKAAVVRFTECLAHEVREAGIAVVCMSPGFVRTRLTEHHVFSEEGRRYLPTMAHSFDGEEQYPPDQAAAVARWLCEHDLRPLTGRYLGVGDDLDALLASAEEIAAQDRRTLRLIP